MHHHFHWFIGDVLDRSPSYGSPCVPLFDACCLGLPFPAPLWFGLLALQWHAFSLLRRLHPPPPPASHPSDDYKVQQAEGFSKVKLFSILDTLLEGTDALLASARERLAAEKGTAALEPWNTGYMMAGDIEKQLDPYFPFETALATWGECFAKLGISYRGATMTLDLLDRKVCVPVEGTRAG